MERRVGASVLAMLAVVVAVLCVLAFRAGGTSTAGPESARALPAVTSSTTKALPDASPAAARKLLAKGGDLTIQILGDSTGNDGNEWVALWVEHLAKDRTVDYNVWDAKANDWRKPYGGTLGEGRSTVTVWNYSVPGTAPDDALEHFDAALPETPDLVIYNYGHNGDAYKTLMDEQDLQAKVAAASPEALHVVTLQNPERGAVKDRAALRTALREWAAEKRLPVVDVAAAFKRGDLAQLMRDDIHPNEAGSKLWLETVVRVVG